MRAFFTIPFLFILMQIADAQISPSRIYAAVDQKVLFCPDSLSHTTDGLSKWVVANFQGDTNKVRAIYAWIAGNIRYDVENMFALNFYETKEEKVTKVLKNRKGICENYAALFAEICQKSGVKAFVVEGYTRQNGFPDYLAHAWCVAMVNGTWKLFDPTWGSGYLIRGKFYQELNNDYFMTDPHINIKTHMPFDYLWQLLPYPVNSRDFLEGRAYADTTRNYFNYADSIAVWEKLGTNGQLSAEARRIEENGLRHSVIFDRLQHIKLSLEYEKQNTATIRYNTAVSDCNDGINQFNDFVNYRNKQFKPAKPDKDIQAMLDKARTKLLSAQTNLSDVKPPDKATEKLLSQLNETIYDGLTRLDEQQKWLDQYFTKPPASRNMMFYERRTTKKVVKKVYR
jgi:hypothetical protein